MTLPGAFLDTSFPRTVYPSARLREGVTEAGDYWGREMGHNLQRLHVTANPSFAADLDTTESLRLGYRGGFTWDGAGWSEVADNHIDLPDNATTYIERSATGTVTTNASGFSASKIPMMRVQTQGGQIVDIRDFRPTGEGSTAGSGGGGTGGAPDPHAASHENGGSDEINVTGLSGLLADPQHPTAHVHSGADITSGLIAPARLGSGAPDATKWLRGDGAWMSLPSFLAGAGTAGMLAMFVAPGVLGDSLLAQAGGIVTVTGALTTTGNINPRGVSLTWPAANAGGVLKNDAAGVLSWAPVDYGELSGVPATFPAAAHGLVSPTHTVAGLTVGHVLTATAANAFAFALNAPAYGDITGKPASFPPSAHTHPASDITAGTFGAGNYSFPGYILPVTDAQAGIGHDGTSLGWQALVIRHTANIVSGLLLKNTAAGAQSPRLFFVGGDGGTWAITAAGTGAAPTLSWYSGGTWASSTGTQRLILSISAFAPAAASGLTLGTSALPWGAVFIGSSLTIGGVAHTWPAANATGVLSNNGSGTLSWSATAPPGAHTHPFTDLTGTMAWAQLPTGTGTWTVGGAATLATTSSLTISNSAAADLRLRETGQALPAGLWSIISSADNLYIRRNTAAAGDFSTQTIALRFSTAGAITAGVWNANAIGVTYGGTGANLSATGPGFVRQTGVGAAFTVAALVAGDLPTHTHAAADVTSGVFATARLGGGTASAGTYLRGDSTWAQVQYSELGGTPATLPPSLHHASHELGGADKISVAGLSGLLADPQTPLAHTHTKSQVTDFAHALVGADHTAAGLTTGQFLKATSATTFAFAAHGLTATDVGAAAAVHTHSAADITSGLLALARGGTAADLSATGPGFLKQAGAGSVVSVAALAAADIPTHDLLTKHSATGLTSGQFLKATGATTFAFQAHGLTAADVGAAPTVHTHTKSQITDFTHALVGADHTASGLTTGHVLQALSATTFGFAALPAGSLPAHTHTAADIVGGNLDWAELPTGTGTWTATPSITGQLTALAGVYINYNTTGALTLGNGATNAYVAMVIAAAAGNGRGIVWRTGSLNRWILQTGGNAESGSNAGSRLELLCYDDAGVNIDTPLFLDRAAGSRFNMTRGLLVNAGGITVNAGGLTVAAGGAGITGATTISGGSLSLSQSAGNVRDFIWTTAGSPRWIMRANGTAEGGSNTGSDFEFIARDDAGASLGNVFTVNRANRQIAVTVGFGSNLLPGQDGVFNLGSDPSALGWRELVIRQTANLAAGLALKQTLAGAQSPRLFFVSGDGGAWALYGIGASGSESLTFNSGGTYGSASGTQRLILTTTSLVPATTGVMSLGSASLQWNNANFSGVVRLGNSITGFRGVDYTFPAAAAAGVLTSTAGGVLSWAASAPPAAHTHPASDITSGQLALARGGTNADLSATGPGFLKQTAAGATVTVAALAAGDLPAHTHSATDIVGGNIDWAELPAASGTWVATPTITGQVIGQAGFWASLNSATALVVGNAAGAANTAALIQSAAGNSRQLIFRTSVNSRWALGASNHAESGSNAGSRFEILAFDDSGTAIDTPVFLNRAAGSQWTFGRGLTVTTGGITVTGNSLFTADLITMQRTSAGQMVLRLVASGMVSGFDLAADNAGAYVWNRENTTIFFGTNNALRARLLATGELLLASDTGYGLFRIGIATTGYLWSFRVMDGVNNPGLFLYGDVSGTPNVIRMECAASVAQPDFVFNFGGTEWMRFSNGASSVKFTQARFDIRGVAYSWPAAQGAAGTKLTNDGAGNLSWT